jgi:hypothetical protein
MINYEKQAVPAGKPPLHQEVAHFGTTVLGDRARDENDEEGHA